MNDGKVMRSVYLGIEEDGKLRQIAHDAKLTKSDLIRAAIALSLPRWLDMDDADIRAEVGATSGATASEDRSPDIPLKPTRPEREKAELIAAPSERKPRGKAAKPAGKPSSRIRQDAHAGSVV